MQINPEAHTPKGVAPRLSILLATKDQSSTLEKCLQGIRNQTFQDYELLILDDGSTDGTSDILHRWAGLDPRIQLFKNSVAKGVIAAYHFLQGLARGDFIWHAASDDFCVDPHFLEDGFRFYAQYPQAAGFFCNTLRIMVPGGKPHGIWGAAGKPRFIHPETFLINFLKGNIVLPGCAAVIRTDFFKEKGGFDSNAGPLCDLLINAKLGACFGFFFMGKISMHSTVYANKSNFGASFSAWERLQCLVHLEIRLREDAHIQRRDWVILWHNFRYLYLSKFFDLEHQFRHARKSLSRMKCLREYSAIILAEYEIRMRNHGVCNEDTMTTYKLLGFSFRNPVKRILIRIKNSLFQTSRISL